MQTTLAQIDTATFNLLAYISLAAYSLLYNNLTLVKLRNAHCTCGAELFVNNKRRKLKQFLKVLRNLGSSLAVDNKI